MTRPRRRGRPALWRFLLLAIMVTAALASSAVWTNAFGVGDRFERLARRIELALDPPPNRPTRRTISVTPRPTLATLPPAPTSGAARPAAGRPARSGSGSVSKAPRPAPTPVR
ncbi:MAG: hypothetical protein M3301_07070, partial [Chloroflexota bacterium]|nr:hypothetical protein [Chloroflexota bacterium]